MDRSTEDIAARLRTASDERPEAVSAVMAESYAEQIDLHHVPALDTDGPMPGEQLASIGTAENEALRRAMPDYHFKSFEAVVRDDTIEMNIVQAGTLPDGRAIAVPVGVVFTVADGNIVRMDAHLDTEAMGPLVEAYQIGGLELPAS